MTHWLVYTKWKDTEYPTDPTLCLEKDRLNTLVSTMLFQPGVEWVKVLQHYQPEDVLLFTKEEL